MRNIVIMSGAGVVLMAGAGLWLGLARSGAAPVERRDVHTYLHINCKHHNHGPKWHQNHGRILGAKVVQGEDDDQDGVESNRRR